MALPAHLRPHRSLAFPFAAILFPLWRVAFRMVNFSWVRPPEAIDFTRLFTLAAVAMVVSYVGAVTIVTILGLRTRSIPRWIRRLIRPSNGALAVFALLSTILWAFQFAGAWLADLYPFWSEIAVYGPLAWPFLLIYTGIFVVGNAIGYRSPSTEVWALLLGTGAVLSVVWLFYLSGWIAGVVHELSAMGR